MSQAVSASQSGSLFDRQVDPAPNEMRAPQYGEVWMRHVMEGGDVRDGNILVFPIVKSKGKKR